MIELKSQMAIMPKEIKEDPIGRPIVVHIPTSDEIGRRKPIIEQVHETLENRRRELCLSQMMDEDISFEIMPNGEIVERSDVENIQDSETRCKALMNRRVINLKVTDSSGLIQKFLRLMALLHRAGAVGHSGTFGMSLDGDGNERLLIESDDNNLFMRSVKKGADRVGSVGYDVELATTKGFSGWFRNVDRRCKWNFDDEGVSLNDE